MNSRCDPLRKLHTFERLKIHTVKTELLAEVPDDLLQPSLPARAWQRYEPIREEASVSPLRGVESSE